MSKWWGLLLGLCLTNALAEIRVVDSRGDTLILDKPAERIIGMAPHVVENLFSAGAGERVVGVVAYSDFPEAATKLPIIGDYSSTNMEAIVALQPDLIVAWDSGHRHDVIDKLRQLGFKVYVGNPRKLEDVARSIRDYGVLMGTEAESEKTAEQFLEQLQHLRDTYSQQSKVSVLYQVWDDPLQTLNGEHIISDVIRLCGGRNAYADAATLAPRISIETVLARDPQVIIASGMGEERPDWLDSWKAWPALSAVEHDQLYFVHPDIIQRHTYRILQGAEIICRQLQQARQAL